MGNRFFVGLLMMVMLGALMMAVVDLHAIDKQTHGDLVALVVGAVAAGCG